jgi:hypothetical protein
MNRIASAVIVSVFTLVIASESSAAVCVNKFVSKPEGGRQNVTLLSGKLTFQEAQALAKAIKERKADGLEWVDEKGKTVARQFGELNVVRPMPVGCDGRASGVVMNVTFFTAVKPVRKMFVRLNPETTVEFDEQSN